MVLISSSTLRPLVSARRKWWGAMEIGGTSSNLGYFLSSMDYRPALRNGYRESSNIVGRVVGEAIR
ncbi:hypothetical protein PHLCEN_2v4514 [Hermanssonia centrifuga]|uniref:Uncharacterized protein n=1 Tax=Hermanssonia centrifuga TaxID=98765 RepID=A0A2R6PNA5_9APHY|nr:hypothetical protein PHLCEN_2v4514 [Hermanssonia centrifuga]